MQNDIKKNRKNCSGLTLVEMIIAIAIMAMVSTGMSIFFIRSWKTNAYIYETGQDSFIASRLVNTTVDNLRRIRSADNGDYPIYSASEFDLVVYMDIDNDNDAEKVHYFLDQDTDEFRIGISEPSASNPPTYSSGDDSVSILSRHVLNDATTPIFSYFSNNYLADPTPFSAPVNSSEIINIKMIKINVWIDIRPYTSPDFINIESFAKLRNI
jgi:prepilin-type N-terminal cleavage/methylation domain-containing protein